MTKQSSCEFLFLFLFLVLSNKKLMKLHVGTLPKFDFLYKSMYIIFWNVTTTDL